MLAVGLGIVPVHRDHRAVVARGNCAGRLPVGGVAERGVLAVGDLELGQPEPAAQSDTVGRPLRREPDGLASEGLERLNSGSTQ